MNRPEETTHAPEPTPERDAEGEAERTEPGTPLIDEDVAGSVNAALPEADE